MILRPPTSTLTYPLFPSTTLFRSDTPVLSDACAEAGVFDEDIANALREAHGVLLAAGLECTLDRRRRWVVENEAVAGARIAVRAGVRAAGLAFDERRAAPRGYA